jgi:hypothetical protein
VVIRIHAEIVERGGEYLARRVEERHTAVRELLDDLGIEEHGPAVQGGIRHPFLNHPGVVGKARGSPHVRHGVLVVRVVGPRPLQNLLIEVLPVRQLGLVQLLVDARFDLAGQEIAAGHDHVIARVAGQQLGLQAFVGIIDVVGNLDAGLFLEFGYRVVGDVVRPVIDVQGLLLGGGGARHDQDGHHSQNKAAVSHHRFPLRGGCGDYSKL